MNDMLTSFFLGIDEALDSGMGSDDDRFVEIKQFFVKSELPELKIALERFLQEDDEQLLLEWRKPRPRWNFSEGAGLREITKKFIERL